MTFSLASAWTDERVSRLKQLWAQGLSGSQIAADLGGITRNAVIGKVHRLHLAGRRDDPPGRNKAQTLADNRLKMRMRRAPSPPRSAEIVEVRPAENAPVPKMLTLQQLTGATCRWPLGHPCDGGFGFCGLIPQTGSVYCEAHHAIAYVKEDSRKRRAA